MSHSGFEPSRLSPVHAARLLAALEAAQVAAGHTGREQHAARTALDRQRADLESAHESAQKLSTRSRDLRNSLHVLRESVDRAKLSALNAGLEGARLGEPVGKALVAMSDEQRNLLARALDAMDEHGGLLGEADRERDRCVAALSQVSDDTRQALAALNRSEQQAQLTAAVLQELHQDFAAQFAGDAESAKIMAETASHVRSAASSLLALTQRTPLGVDALRELLGPLLALVPSEDGPR